MSRIALVVVCRQTDPESKPTVRPFADVADIFNLPKNRETYGKEWLIIGARTPEGALRLWETYKRQGPRLEWGQSLIEGDSDGDSEETS